MAKKSSLTGLLIRVDVVDNDWKFSIRVVTIQTPDDLAFTLTFFMGMNFNALFSLMEPT